MAISPKYEPRLVYSSAWTKGAATRHTNDDNDDTDNDDTDRGAPHSRHDNDDAENDDNDNDDNDKCAVRAATTTITITTTMRQ